MDNWYSKTLPYREGHQRTVSAVGYHETLYPNYDKFETVKLPNEKRLPNQYCASYMDISNIKETSNDSKRKFSWRSPASNSNSNGNSERSKGPSQQRPFESAFKAAISKMKESSIYRISDVDRGSKSTAVHGQNISEDFYNRNCMTLQPRKTPYEYQVPQPSNKIFRCNSSSDKARNGNVDYQNDYNSESESERTEIDDIHRSISNLASDQFKNQKDVIQIDPRINGASNGFKVNSGSQVVIPALSNAYSQQTKTKSSVVSETFISPSVTMKQQSANPRMGQYSMDLEESTDCEPLPSVQDIIAKVEAMTNDSSNKIMSRSLVLTPEKPPLKKLQKSGSQRTLDGYSSSSQSDQSSPSGKRMSGVYKKTSTIPTKGNSINKMPVDFQKLHSAFLEQKQEIHNLKHELEEKKNYIIQLESEIRNYEPWR